MSDVDGFLDVLEQERAGRRSSTRQDAPLLARPPRPGAVASLPPHRREVLGLMADGGTDGSGRG
ncbi:hypothetical protein [Arsenicicoccus dermatophilus]|uniref:hypothetical protein n=1 Tax=Arsenicicoccus dermatophilus TaxID=1076331 RepID=UPI001F4CFF44|nr:hypothetical protein [Arsenicicoccus dermatophilus]MCH8612067.1 hypothetical protein [Arsenicicoccus dermatophilus]